MMSLRKSVLIVEDNVDLCDLLSIIVTGLGYEVVVAATGEEAVQRAAAIKPDLILMDIGLPKLSGVDATIQIKAQPATQNTPVVILSALPMYPHGKAAIKAGAVQILQKPVKVTEIQQSLLKHLQREPNPPAGSSADPPTTKRFHHRDIILH